MAMAMVRVSAVTTAAKATGATIGAAAKTTMAAMATAKGGGHRQQSTKSGSEKKWRRQRRRQCRLRRRWRQQSTKSYGNGKGEDNLKIQNIPQVVDSVTMIHCRAFFAVPQINSPQLTEFVAKLKHTFCGEGLDSCAGLTLAPPFIFG